jgi:hypothetical protein
MKKIGLFCTFSVILFMLVGCGSPEPTDTVENFFRAAQQFDMDGMTQTMVPSNAGDMIELNSAADLGGEDDYSPYLLEYLQSNAEKITYTITESNAVHDEAHVTVAVNYVDSGPVFQATIGEYFLQSFAQAFTDDEMTDEESDQLFDSIMKDQINTIDETYVETTVRIELVRMEDTWYIKEASEELLDVVMSGFISAAKDLADSFSIDEGEEDSTVSPAEDNPEDVLWEINNFVIADLWNSGFCDIQWYLETGKGATGREIDIDFTRSQLAKAMEKKAEYDEYMVGLDDRYSEIKEVWNKLSAEIDSLYEQVKADAPSLNTDIFVQYRNAFSDLVYDLN